jgi:Recombinase
MGKPKIIGVEQEIVPEEAAVIVRIWEMQAEEFSYARIAKTLKAEGCAPKRKELNGDF